MKILKDFLSPCKINLFLKIFHNDFRNYHNIISLFLKIDFFDEIRIKSLDDKIIKISYSGQFSSEMKDISVDISDLDFSKKYDDFIFSSVKDFYFDFLVDSNFGIGIEIKKNIPIGAGLGGSSANLATIIDCLFEMFSEYIKKDSKRIDYVEKYTSDGCFFLEQSRLSLVSGVGSSLKSIDISDKFKDFFILIIFPNYNSNTRLMYQKFDHNNKKTQPELQKEYNLLKKNIINFSEIDDFLKIGNDFELFSDEIIKNIIKRCRKYEKNTFLSGSGSSCFLLTKNYSVFEKIEQEFKGYDYFLKVIKLWFLNNKLWLLFIYFF